MEDDPRTSRAQNGIGTVSMAKHRGLPVAVIEGGQQLWAASLPVRNHSRGKVPRPRFWLSVQVLPSGSDRDPQNVVGRRSRGL